MRVLHVVGDSKMGGEVFVIRTLIEVARSLGWDPEVLTTDPQAIDFYRENSIPTVWRDVIRRPIHPVRDVSGVIRLTRFLRNSDYRLVHTHTSKAGVIGRAAARLARIPYIVHTVHGFAFHEQSSWKELTAYGFLERMAARWCDRVVTVSHFHRRWALELGIGKPEQVIAIPNGVYPFPAAGAGVAKTRAQWGVSTKEVVIVSTSRLARQKGIDDLIRSLPLLSTYTDVPFRVVLAGNGDQGPELEQLASTLGVRDKLVFLGFQEDIPNILRASDIFVLPSLREGLSISLLEAMVLGKAIVASTIGSNLEVLEDGRSGLLVPPSDPEALARALAVLMRDPALAAQLGERARRVAATKYSLAGMADAYRSMYVELTNGSGAGAAECTIGGAIGRETN